jgi:hypothetical protein
LATTLQHSKRYGLVLPACSCNATLALRQMHVPRFAANEGFVRFNFATIPADLGE